MQPANRCPTSTIGHQRYIYLALPLLPFPQLVHRQLRSKPIPQTHYEIDRINQRYSREGKEIKNEVSREESSVDLPHLGIPSSSTTEVSLGQHEARSGFQHQPVLPDHDDKKMTEMQKKKLSYIAIPRGVAFVALYFLPDRHNRHDHSAIQECESRLVIGSMVTVRVRAGMKVRLRSSCKSGTLTFGTYGQWVAMVALYLHSSDPASIISDYKVNRREIKSSHCCMMMLNPIHYCFQHNLPYLRIASPRIAEDILSTFPSTRIDISHSFSIILNCERIYLQTPWHLSPVPYHLQTQTQKASCRLTESRQNAFLLTSMATHISTTNILSSHVTQISPIEKNSNPILHLLEHQLIRSIRKAILQQQYHKQSPLSSVDKDNATSPQHQITPPALPEIFFQPYPYLSQQT
ncbi:uncharacterized protein MYCFIDRAFT_177705 [Pseudocercospora fijiensis CIRAD86]|uniref:Uncharacterized protein n=1 Tax=Pseudocercospora fijiensis (strain CIRAD86) TaxID=383855 RepID=M3ANH9_PSEFD|nr:uncharacterized protein MYCFIDRAFT_177705 [Pseudocercospora fijiensis CIRAD86]EME79027.1 hypothetical protein MYCFIDRAFT_177705 [Pseudocercospora fijiensis CIRAD86]